MGPYAYWLATGVAFVVSVFCSVTEGALASYSPSRLDEHLKDSRRRERVQRHLGRIERYRFSAIVLNAVSDVGLVFACTLAFHVGTEGALKGVYAFLTSLTVVIVGAKVIPRALASHHAEALLPRVLPVIALADKVGAPLFLPLRALHEGIAWTLAGDPKERRAEEIRDDILSAALEASREGILDRQASEIIEAVIDFKDVEVREIMTPRTDMASIEVNASLQDAAKVALEQGHSRIPVYEGTRDRIVGVLYAKDLLVRLSRSGAAPADTALRSLLRKPYFVPETKLIGELLREFRAKKVHIAIVLDEYGGTAGLVTIEDIIEEVVGEIEDEYAPGEETRPPLERIDDHTAEVDARLHVRDVNEALDLALPEAGDYETLGGLLFYLTGKVPKKGERCAHEDVEFTVVDGDERRINRVRVAVKPEQPTV